ncbi:MAG TPA: hypothetical protein VH851_14485 [Candidatus Binatia bacterium]|jgi:hypothetical protein
MKPTKWTGAILLISAIWVVGNLALAPFAIREISWTVRGAIVIACPILLGIAVAFSKRDSIAEEQPAGSGRSAAA